MKKVLITGAGSYIGTSFEKYIKQNFPNQYQIDTVDMQDPSWRDTDFSEYDTIFHVAGIAHSDTGKVSDERKAFYYKINTELTVETAKKAKQDGAGQFIFMSSIIVYGDSAPIGKQKLITRETPLAPANFYGDSKVQAELGIRALEDDSFRVVVLRPPMIYGKDSKGNYPILSRLAAKTPIFPNVKNQRSMLYVENLAEFVRLMIENRESGVFFPQNAEWVNTTELVRVISQVNGKHMCCVSGFAWALKLLSHVTGLVNKAFGNMCYDKSMSEYTQDYRVFDLKASIERTEGK